MNHFFQRFVTRGVVWGSRRFRDGLGNVKQHFHATQKYGVGREGLVVLELGTGWLPNIAVGMSLGGAKKVYTVDIHRHMRARALEATLLHFQKNIDSEQVQKTLGTVGDGKRESLERAISAVQRGEVEEALASLDIEYLVQDVRYLPLQDNYVDLVVSRTTLEHIPEDDLEEILVEFRRVISAKGIMNHLVDLQDHYAMFDPAITPYNFLQYNDRRWSLYNTDFQWQNRLRINDYVRLHESAGFEVIAHDDERKHGSLLSRVKLDARFQRYTQEDLEVTTSWIVSRGR